MSPSAQLNVIAFLAYERLGGTEGLDRIVDEASRWDDEYIPLVKGESQKVTTTGAWTCTSRKDSAFQEMMRLS